MGSDYFTYLEKDTLDNLLEGYQLISFDYTYLYVNKAVVEQSTYKTKEDLLGHTMMEKFPGIEKTEMFEKLKHCMKNREPVDMENEFKFPDDSSGWFELRMRPVPRGVFILSMDITERKRAEEDKANYLLTLERVMYTISHKVRNPVTNIMGFASILEKEDFDQNELKKLSGYMMDSANALDKVTREFSQFVEEYQINEQKKPEA